MTTDVVLYSISAVSLMLGIAGTIWTLFDSHWLVFDTGSDLEVHEGLWKIRFDCSDVAAPADEGLSIDMKKNCRRLGGFLTATSPQRYFSNPPPTKDMFKGLTHNFCDRGQILAARLAPKIVDEIGDGPGCGVDLEDEDEAESFRELRDDPEDMKNKWRCNIRVGECVKSLVGKESEEECDENCPPESWWWPGSCLRDAAQRLTEGCTEVNGREPDGRRLG